MFLKSDSKDFMSGNGRRHLSWTCILLPGGVLGGGPRLRNLTAKLKNLFFLDNTVRYIPYLSVPYGPRAWWNRQIWNSDSGDNIQNKQSNHGENQCWGPDPESVPDPQDLHVFGPPESWIRIHKSEVRVRIRLLIIPFSFSHKSVEKTEIML
jgi:hypothetical protein